MHGWNGRITGFQETRPGWKEFFSGSSFSSGISAGSIRRPKGNGRLTAAIPFTSERQGRTGLPGREEPAEWIIRRAGGIPAATTGFFGWTPFPSKRWPPAVSAVCIPPWGRRRKPGNGKGSIRPWSGRLTSCIGMRRTGFIMMWTSLRRSRAA